MSKVSSDWKFPLRVGSLYSVLVPSFLHSCSFTSSIDILLIIYYLFFIFNYNTIQYSSCFGFGQWPFGKFGDFNWITFILLLWTCGLRGSNYFTYYFSVTCEHLISIYVCFEIFFYNFLDIKHKWVLIIRFWSKITKIWLLFQSKNQIRVFLKLINNLSAHLYLFWNILLLGYVVNTEDLNLICSY